MGCYGCGILQGVMRFCGCDKVLTGAVMDLRLQRLGLQFGFEGFGFELLHLGLRFGVLSSSVYGVLSWGSLI